MSLRNPRMTDEALAELDALDAALRGEQVGPQHADLRTLVTDVRDVAPAPTPAFLAALEEEIRQEFPRTHEAVPSVPSRRRPTRWLLTGAGGLVATAAVAAVVIVSVGADRSNDATDVAGGPPSSARLQSEAARSSPAEATSSATADNAVAEPALGSAALAVEPSPGGPPVATPPSTDDAALGVERRRVQRSAALDLTVAPKDVQKTADEVVRATDRFGGIVQSSSISVGDEASGQALLVVRVPSERVGGALAAYSRLGNVARRTQDAEDVTATVVSAQDRLADARAERRGLLRALGRAQTPQAIDALRARVRLNRSEISRLSGELRSLRTRVDLATVTVTISDGDAPAQADDDGQWSIGDAARDAGRLLEVGAGVLLLALAVLVPAGLLIAGGVAAGRVVRRRRRVPV